MRDIGIIVWVVLLLVGVTGSIISSARRHMQQASPPARRPSPPQRPVTQTPIVQPSQQPMASPQRPVQPPQRPVQPPVQERAAAERPVVRRTVAPPHDPLPDHPLIATHATRGSKVTRRLFSSHEGLVGAVIAAEVLGKPVALREYTTY